MNVKAAERKFIVIITVLYKKAFLVLFLSISLIKISTKSIKIHRENIPLLL